MGKDRFEDWEVLQYKREPHLILSEARDLVWWNKGALQHFPHLKSGVPLEKLSFPFPQRDLLDSFDLIQKGLTSTSCMVREIHPGQNPVSYFVEMFDMGGVNTMMVFYDMREGSGKVLGQRELLMQLTHKNQFYLDMMHILSHDLRAPLSNIMGLANVAKMQMEKSIEKAGNSLDLLGNNASKVSEMIAEIFQLVMEERLEALPEVVSLDEIIQKSLVTCTSNPSLPEVHLYTEPLGRAFTDKMYAERCVSNVIENAYKYLKASDHGEVRITGIQTVGWKGVQVEDNGPGIPEDILPKIFDIQFRFAKTTIEGQGMGLYMVKRWMEKMNGRVEVESNVREGTRVRLWFPAEPPKV